MFFFAPDFGVAVLELVVLGVEFFGVACLEVLGGAASVFETDFGVAATGFLLSASSTALLSSSASNIFLDGFRFLGDSC